MYIVAQRHRSPSGCLVPTDARNTRGAFATGAFGCCTFTLDVLPHGRLHRHRKRSIGTKPAGLPLSSRTLRSASDYFKGSAPRSLLAPCTLYLTPPLPPHPKTQTRGSTPSSLPLSFPSPYPPHLTPPPCTSPLHAQVGDAVAAFDKLCDVQVRPPSGATPQWCEPPWPSWRMLIRRTIRSRGSHQVHMSGVMPSCATPGGRGGRLAGGAG